MPLRPSRIWMAVVFPIQFRRVARDRIQVLLRAPIGLLLIFAVLSVSACSGGARESLPADDGVVLLVGPGPDLSSRLIVEVVDEESGEPLPGVAIVYRDAVDFQEGILGGEDPFGDWGDPAVCGGRVYRTGSRGEVAVPRPRVGGVINLSNETLAGTSVFFEEGQESVTIEAHALVRRGVRVVDRSGLPVPGVPVAASLGRRLLWRGTTTGPYGRVVVPDLESRELVHDGEARAERLTIGLALPGAGNPASLTHEETVLVLPPTGSLVVEVVDASGRLLQQDVFVAIRGLGRAGRRLPPGKIMLMGPGPAARQPLAWSPWTDDRLLGRVTSSGRAVFAHVPPGQLLEATVWDLEGSYCLETAGIRGPGRPGGAVTARIKLTRPLSWVSGRIVDREGKPYKNACMAVWACDLADRLAWVIRGGCSYPQGPFLVRTDPLGRFRLPRGDPREPASLALMFTLESEPREAHALIRGGEAGIVVLDPQPLVARGRVTDPDGRPISGARVFSTGPLASFTVTDPEGRFRLQGGFGDEPVFVSKSGPPGPDRIAMTRLRGITCDRPLRVALKGGNGR